MFRAVLGAVVLVLTIAYGYVAYLLGGLAAGTQGVVLALPAGGMALCAIVSIGLGYLLIKAFAKEVVAVTSVARDIIRHTKRSYPMAFWLVTGSLSMIIAIALMRLDNAHHTTRPTMALIASLPFAVYGLIGAFHGIAGLLKPYVTVEEDETVPPGRVVMLVHPSRPDGYSVQ